MTVTADRPRTWRMSFSMTPTQIVDGSKTVTRRHADTWRTIRAGDLVGEHTVMFADIVNFTQVAGNMSPSQVFTMLNRIFSAFDELAERFEVEKIKTIGDAYMVAGGINQSAENYTGDTTRTARVRRC